MNAISPLHHVRQMGLASNHARHRRGSHSEPRRYRRRQKYRAPWFVLPSAYWALCTAIGGCMRPMRNLEHGARGGTARGTDRWARSGEHRRCADAAAVALDRSEFICSISCMSTHILAVDGPSARLRSGASIPRRASRRGAWWCWKVGGDWGRFVEQLMYFSTSRSDNIHACSSYIDNKTFIVIFFKV